jgi:hypothetical protein
MSASSYPMTHIGSKRASPPISRQVRADPEKRTNFLRTAFNHSQSGESEAEYDRLRDLARQEAGKRSSCFDKVEIPPCITCWHTKANTEARRIKHMSAEMVLRRISCRKRGSSTQRRWISIISRLPIISSGRTMRKDGCRTIRLICMVSLSRRQRIFWSRGSDMRNRMARLTCMCKCHLHFNPDNQELISRMSESWAKATTQ